MMCEAGSSTPPLLSGLMEEFNAFNYSPIQIVYHNDNVPPPTRPGTAQLPPADTPSKASAPERDEDYSASSDIDRDPSEYIGSDGSVTIAGTSTVDIGGSPQRQNHDPCAGGYGYMIPVPSELLPGTPDRLPLDPLAALSPRRLVRQIAAENEAKAQAQTDTPAAPAGRLAKRPAAKQPAAQGSQKGTLAKKPAAKARAKSVCKKPAAKAHAKSVCKKPASKHVAVAKTVQKKASGAMKRPSRA